MRFDDERYYTSTQQLKLLKKALALGMKDAEVAGLTWAELDRLVNTRH